MIIKNIKTDKFGRFDGNTVNVDLTEGLNVIYGGNEAGKSTLRHAMRDLIFGFAARKAEQHPYKPYSGSQLEVGGRVKFGDHAPTDVRRSLGIRAQSTRDYNGQLLEIGNDPLQEMGKVSKQLYKGLFELDLGDLAELDVKQWNEVEDRITLQYGLENMLSPQQVLERLENQMHALWRPHLRGRYAVKDIDERLRDLVQKKSSHKRKMAGFSEQIERKSDIESALKRVDESMASLNQWIEQARLYLPKWRLTNEMEEIEAVLASANMPEFEAFEFKELLRENAALRQQKSELDERLSEVNARIAEAERLVVEGGPDRLTSSQIATDLAACEQEHKRFEDLHTDLKRMKGHLEQKSSELTRDPWNDVLMEKWRDISLNALDRKLKSRCLFRPGAPMPYVISAVGAASAAAGYFLTHGLALKAGGAIVLAGLVLIVKSFFNGSFVFDDIYFRDKVWWNRKAVVSACESLKLSIGDYEEVQSVYDAQNKVVRNLEEKLTGHIEAHPLPNEPAGEPQKSGHGRIMTQAARLIKALDRSDESRSISETAGGEKRVLQDQKRSVGHALMLNQSKLTIMNSALKRLGETVESGLKELERLEKLKDRKESILDELAGDVLVPEGYPDLKKSPNLEEEIAFAQKKLVEMSEKRSHLLVELKGLEKDELRLLEDERIDGIEAEIERLKAEREKAINEYNRLRMIHTVIAFADDAFRRKYQPDILRRASELLSAFTAGAYDTLTIDGDMRMQVKNTEKGHFIPVHEMMSRGTLEQIYMALRLAVAETVDEEGIKLPIILDEVFVNWDQKRLDKALEVIGQIARERQVIYLTCHDWMLDKMQKSAEINVATLST